jgi:(2Fe-2S) ferredoxin
MSPFEKHVFICTSGQVCPAAGGAFALYVRLKELVKQAGLDSKIRINQAGCMSQCGNGPMIVVYPDNVWYGAVTAEGADAIFHEHLVGGKPVERIRYHPLRPGSNKTGASTA